MDPIMTAPVQHTEGTDMGTNYPVGFWNTLIRRA